MSMTLNQIYLFNNQNVTVNSPTVNNQESLLMGLGLMAMLGISSASDSGSIFSNTADKTNSNTVNTVNTTEIDANISNLKAQLDEVNQKIANLSIEDVKNEFKSNLSQLPPMYQNMSEENLDAQFNLQYKSASSLIYSHLVSAARADKPTGGNRIGSLALRFKKNGQNNSFIFTDYFVEKAKLQVEKECLEGEIYTAQKEKQALIDSGQTEEVSSDTTTGDQQSSFLKFFQNLIQMFNT